jgi:hypothetical protein
MKRATCSVIVLKGRYDDEARAARRHSFSVYPKEVLLHLLPRMAFGRMAFVWMKGPFKASLCAAGQSPPRLLEHAPR